MTEENVWQTEVEEKTAKKVGGLKIVHGGSLQEIQAAINAEQKKGHANHVKTLKLMADAGVTSTAELEAKIQETTESAEFGGGKGVPNGEEGTE